MINRAECIHKLETCKNVVADKFGVRSMRLFGSVARNEQKISRETCCSHGEKGPIYIIDEARLRSNLELISQVARRTQAEWILAFKAFALWKTFPIFREYINSTTASSLSEARLALEEFGAKCHTFSPAYTDYEIDEIARCSSHLTFNSLTQYERYHERVGSAP